MSDIFPKEVRAAAEKLGSDWIKGSDFENDGLILQVGKPMEVVAANNPKYGATETDFLVKQEIIEEGQTLRFHFIGTDGVERKFDTKSAPFFIGFKQCEDLGVGDWVKIVRTGKTDKTRYSVEKVEAPSKVTPKKDYKGKDYPPSDEP